MVSGGDNMVMGCVQDDSGGGGNGTKRRGKSGI